MSEWVAVALVITTWLIVLSLLIGLGGMIHRNRTNVAIGYPLTMTKTTTLKGYVMDDAGGWDRLPHDDPSAVSREDQIRAEALERIRDARTFMSLTINPNESGVRIAAVLASLIESIDCEDGQDDSAQLQSALCENLVRLYFQDVPDRPDADAIDIMSLLLNKRQILDNVMSCTDRILREKGY